MSGKRIRIFTEEEKIIRNLRSKNYRENNKENIKLYGENYRKNNKDKIAEKNKNYYESTKKCVIPKDKNIVDKDIIKLRNKKYRDENKELIKLLNRNYYLNNKDNINKKILERNKIDELFYLSSKMRKSLCKIFKNNGYTKKSKTQDILGCSFIEFKLYLESKFKPWMNWNNKGLYNGELNYGWDIDHITPLATAKTEDDIIRLNHYTNLQPLCSKVNRVIKRDKII